MSTTKKEKRKERTCKLHLHTYMYVLCASGAVNTQGFVWKVFMRYI